MPIVGVTSTVARKTVCMIGDSNTANGKAFRTALLAADPTYAFVGDVADSAGYAQEGVGGHTCAQIYNRISEVPLASLYHVMAGTNDIKNGNPADTAPAAANYLAAVNALRARDCDNVIAVGCLPYPTDPAGIDLQVPIFNGLVSAGVAAWGPKVQYVDYETYIRGYAGYPNSLFAPADIHLHDAGHTIMGEYLQSQIVALGLSLTPRGGGIGHWVDNIMGSSSTVTQRTLRPGYWCISWDVVSLSALPSVGWRDAGLIFNFTQTPVIGVRNRVVFLAAHNLYTIPTVWTVTATNCVIARVMIEPLRAHQNPSAYSPDMRFLDTSSGVNAGELAA